MFAVTLKQLRENGACFSGYNKVVRALQEKPFTSEDKERESYLKYKHNLCIPLVDILESNGLDDALWATQCLVGRDRDLRLFAVWCARQVQHLMVDSRSITALNVADAFMNERATKIKLIHTYTAASAAAASAAYAAAGAAGRAAQKEMFILMCRGKAPWQISERN